MTDSTPPRTQRRPVTDEYHGETIADPYRWLEADDEAVREWVERQNRHAESYLSTCDARNRLRSRFADLTAGPEFESMAVRANGCFREVRHRGDERATVEFGDHLDATTRTVVAPDDFGDGTVDWWVPSWDGTLVACGVAEDGSESYDIVVVTTEETSEVGSAEGTDEVGGAEDGGVVERIESVGQTKPFLVAWGSSGLYYVRTRRTDESVEKSIRYRDVGTSGDETLQSGIDPGVWPRLVTGPESQHLLGSFTRGWDDSDVYRWDPDAEEFRQLFADAEGLFKPRLVGDTAYFLTGFEADNYRIVATDLPEGDGFREIVPEREDAILRDFHLLDDALAAHYERDAHSTVELYSLSGDRRSTLSLDGYASVDRVHGTRAGPERFVQYQSFVAPTRVSRFDGGTLRTVAGSEVETSVNLTVEQVWYESADGTEVPAFVVSNSGSERDGEGPAVVRGYGGFQQSVTPEFDPYLLAFLEDGGTYVQPNLRGGGEFGKQWHEEGRRLNKRNTFEDFIAAAEHVADEGYAEPDRIAAWGASNGGLTVGASVVERPALFAAAICDVPLLDMLRIDQFAFGDSWVAEYGSPDDPETFRYLRDYSPYHNVEEAAYPAMLFETDEQDARVHPSHARKMVAKLQSRTTSDNPVLLRTTDSMGHANAAAAADEVAKKVAEWSFLYSALGME